VNDHIALTVSILVLVEPAAVLAWRTFWRAARWLDEFFSSTSHESVEE
jgi:hypothetical protein